MLSVVIPTLNSERTLSASLAALVPAAVDGLVREVIVADGGSTDRTAAIAEAAGATLVCSGSGRGVQLKAGAERARHPWLLFLHSDTVLDPGWEDAAREFIAGIACGTRPDTAAAFRFALDDTGLRPRLLERIVAARCALLRLPYGDQGLLISRALYDRIGGYAPLPLMEDVDIVGRLGRRRIAMLPARAITSSARYRREGYARRSLRNLACLTLYALRVPPQVLARLYTGST